MESTRGGSGKCSFCEGELDPDKEYNVCDKCIQYVENLENFIEYLRRWDGEERVLVGED